MLLARNDVLAETIEMNGDYGRGLFLFEAGRGGGTVFFLLFFGDESVRGSLMTLLVIFLSPNSRCVSFMNKLGKWTQSRRE